MKIAIFSDTFFPQINGVASVAYSSAISLASRGHDVLVITPHIKGNITIPHTPEHLEVAYLPSVPIYVYPRERFSLFFGIEVWRRLKKFKPDIIHSHTPFGAGWMAVIASRLLKVKLIGTHHTFFDFYLQHIHLDYGWTRILSWRYTILYYNRCHLVLSPTQSLGNDLLSHGLRSRLIPHAYPVDIVTFHLVSPDQKEILKKQFNITEKSLVYMGRFSYEKNINQVIQAFAVAHKRYPNLQLMIVGDGPEKKTLENLTNTLGVSSSVIFTGVLRDKKLAQALSANELFITASKSDNMPVSILEGEACGLPIIGVTEKGIPEMITDGHNGLLSSADDVDMLAQNILKIIGNDELSKRMSLSSRACAEEHSPARITDILEKIYIETVWK